MDPLRSILILPMDPLRSILIPPMDPREVGIVFIQLTRKLHPLYSRSYTSKGGGQIGSMEEIKLMLYNKGNQLIKKEA